MKKPPTEAQKALTLRVIAVWPAIVAFGLLFVILKLVVYPQLDWVVLVSGVLLTIVGIQLRQARRKLRTAWTTPEACGRGVSWVAPGWTGNRVNSVFRRLTKQEN